MLLFLLNRNLNKRIQLLHNLKHDKLKLQQFSHPNRQKYLIFQNFSSLSLSIILKEFTKVRFFRYEIFYTLKKIFVISRLRIDASYWIKKTCRTNDLFYDSWTKIKLIVCWCSRDKKRSCFIFYFCLE